MWRTFSCWASLIVESGKDLVPLHSVWWLNAPIRKSTIIQFFHFRGWRTRSEGQETKERLGRPLWPPSPQLKHVQTPRLPISSSHFFTFRLHLTNSSSHLLTFSSFFRPPPPPLTLQSQAFGCQWDQATARCMSVEKNGWLIQSSLLFLRQRRVISGTAKAFWCIAFMLWLAPSPLPQKSKLLWSRGGGRRASQSHQRPERACFSGRHTAVSRLPSPQGGCCQKSSVRCQHHVQTRSESYQSVLGSVQWAASDWCYTYKYCLLKA